MLRIIAGRYKNKRLNAPKENTRPTKDMVKEALFSSLGPLYDDESLLDVFAGSGAIGLEAISRGIGKVHLNDYSKDAYEVIKTNSLDIKGNIKITNLDYKDLLNNLDESFDYIYLDPPYAFIDYEGLFKIIENKELLKKKGLLILETAKETKIDDIYGIFKLVKKKRYGISYLYYFKRGEYD